MRKHFLKPGLFLTTQMKNDNTTAGEAVGSTAPKRKKETYRVVHLGIPGHGTIPVTMVVLPDHWKQDAKRWKDMESRGWRICSRGRLSAKYREWRTRGGRVKKGVGAFGSIVSDFVAAAASEGLEAIEGGAA